MSLKLIPVLPPTELSTAARSVVGICMSCIPLANVEATKPAISPVIPPPIASIRVSRPNFCEIKSL